MKTKVLSIQIPAPCPLRCAFCRTPNHNQGNPREIVRTVKEIVSKYDEVYLTSNGETGLSPIFDEIVNLVRSQNLPLAVLCATERSIIPELCRVEISLNQYTKPLAIQAIKKARQLSIPTVISMVDTGTGEPINIENVIEQYNVDGVLVRALQPEGRSQKEAGLTRWFSRVGVELGRFPVAAYNELAKLGVNTTCINHNGDIVPLIGGV